MQQRLFNLTVIGLLVFLSACNLPAGGNPASAGQASPAAPTTSVATPAVASTEAPATQELLTFYEEIPSPPADYLDVLKQRIDEGTWTREEGLVTLLKLFANEIAFSETGIDASTLLETEGSGVAAVAIEYLQNGTDEATKTEITRLLNLIVPTPESLLRYSQVDTGQGHSTLKMASPSAQTPDCAAFWRAGFPDNRTSSFPCFLANSQTIGGNSYKVFFPAAWMTDETRRRYYDLTRQAIADSIPVMQRYGQMRSIYFVFSYLADPEYPINGMAITYTRGFRPDAESCPVVLFPAMLNLSNSTFQQAIAHEIFHCFTAFNLYDQEHGAGYESASWWVEGSAQYFSNLVYPRADMEYRWLKKFNRRSVTTRLTEMTYENFLFFQFLANQIGPEGVISLLRTMPTVPGEHAQVAALAAYPNMANLFEQFAQEFLDNRIVDTSGAVKPYTPIYVDVGSINAPGVSVIGRYDTFLYQPFVLLRYKVSFGQAKKYLVTTPERPPDARVQFRLAAAPGFWERPELTVDAGCQDLEYVFYTISARPQLSVAGVRALAEAQEAVCTSGCLVGTWKLDNNHYRTYLRSFRMGTGADEPLVNWVIGDALVSFDQSGNISFVYSDFTTQMFLPVMEHLLDNRQMPSEMRIIMNGKGSARYTATETTLFTSDSVINLQFQVKLAIDGVLVDAPVNFPIDQSAFSGAPTEGASQYLCQGNLLIVQTPAPDSPALIYSRIAR